MLVVFNLSCLEKITQTIHGISIKNVRNKEPYELRTNTLVVNKESIQLLILVRDLLSLLYLRCSASPDYDKFTAFRYYLPRFIFRFEVLFCSEHLTLKSSLEALCNQETATEKFHLQGDEKEWKLYGKPAMYSSRVCCVEYVLTYHIHRMNASSNLRTLDQDSRV